MANIPAPRDDGERDTGHHVGSRWRTKPDGDWFPDRDQEQPDRPQPLPADVDGEHLGGRR